VGVDKDNATAVTVIAEGKTRQMVSVGSGKEKKWAAAEEPEKPVEMLGNWVGALFRLSAKEYLADNEVPELTPLAKLELEEEGAPSDTLELAWTEAEDEKKDYFAKSDFTGAWVELSRFSAESVASDLSSILQSE
jgi:hypothetical protein